MTYDDFLALCANRRSIRYFDQKPVSEQEISKLLELARQAPSVENLQPWHFHVITNPELRQKLMDTSCYGNFVAGTSVFVVITCDMSLENRAPEPVWNPRELEYSCVTAGEHILLGSNTLGLGSCWVSLHHGKVHEILGLPHHVKVIDGMMIGHFRKGEEKASGTHERRPIQQTYTMHA